MRTIFSLGVSGGAERYDGCCTLHDVVWEIALWPVSYLKENWAGETELPPNLGKPTSQYMSELKENLEVALEYARHHGDLAQANYANITTLVQRTNTLKLVIKW